MIVYAVFLEAYILFQRIGHRLLLRQAVAGDQLFNGLGINLLEDSLAETPGIQVADTNNLAEHDDGGAGGGDFEQALFPYLHGVGIGLQIRSKFMGNLTQDLPVGFFMLAG